MKNEKFNLDKFLKNFNLLTGLQSIGKPIKSVSLNSNFNKKILGKSAIYKRSFKKNKIISLKDIRFVSPGKGISGLEFYRGKKRLTKDVKKNDYLSNEHFNLSTQKKFNRKKIKIYNKKWGLIGRLGDYEQFIDDTSDLIEIHLTWRELLNPKLPKKNYKSELVIHAPEYFNDQLVDFTSNNKKIINNSLEMIENLKILIE